MRESDLALDLENFVNANTESGYKPGIKQRQCLFAAL